MQRILISNRSQVKQQNYMNDIPATKTSSSEAAIDKKRKNLKPLSKIFPYLARYKPQVAAALFFLALAAATTLTLPVAVRNMIDKGFLSNNVEFIGNYFTALIAVAGLLAIASSCRYYFVIWLGERVISDLRKDVFSHISELSISFFDRSQTGELISRLTADTTQIKSAVGATASMALRNIILAFGALAAMIYTSPRLSFIVIGAIPLIIIPIVSFGRAVRKRSRDAQDTLANATAYASESIVSIRTVQAFSTGHLVKSNFSNAIESAFEAARKAIATRAMLTAFAIFLIFSSVIGVLWFGAQDVLKGTMTPGVLTQFLLYAVFAAGSMGALSEVWGELSQAAGAAERITELLDEKAEITAPKNFTKLPEKIKGNMQFDKVHFAYESRPNAAALKGLSLDIKAGETIAVVGASGAGKSTLFSLMLRFYDPTSGSIKIDGMDIRTLDPKEMRKQIAIVPQDTVIFATTAAENIGMGKEGSTREEIILAAKAASAHEFIIDTEEAYNTQLGERGVMLSGGQRQRIAIARAILKNAPILLLDEATSALDAESERLVQNALETLMEGRTTIVIAHRLATILKADRILVMDGGKIVEEGTHKTLSKKKNGIYARLASLQFDAAK